MTLNILYAEKTKKPPEKLQHPSLVKLIKIIKKMDLNNQEDRNDEQYLDFNDQNIENVFSGKNANGEYQNKVLVKRIVPHGLKSPNYEFDSRYHTKYLPLVRYHDKLGKPRVVWKNLEEKSKLNDENSDDINKNRKRRGNFEIVSRQPRSGENGKVDDVLLQPFLLQKPRKISFNTILDDIAIYIDQLSTRSEVRRLKYAILGVLEGYVPKMKLRGIPTASEERDDPIMKELYEEFAAEKPNNKPDPKKWLPYYSFWNYWTVCYTRSSSSS